ncbi:MAG: DUF423 domain-containing protein [Chitinophagales bacterium]|nr:DUF423 domain-containing protein [Chitinophagales bacterium]
MKFFILAACVTGALAVVFGAFGAHGLKPHLSPEQLQSYETAVKYQFYHTFALLAIGILMNIYPKLNLALAGDFFLVGIILFSGSIYLLSCKELLGLGNFSKILGPITPIGGLCFIVGWVITFIRFWSFKP